MITRNIVFSLAVVFAVCVAQHVAAQSTSDNTPHPLEVHMKHWISGSGQWRAPNPNFDPAAKPRTSGWIREFGVNWAWGPNKQHMIGEIVAFASDGQVLNSGVLYAFYNPVTEKVIDIQVGRNGIFDFGEDRVRTKSTPYGDPEIGDVVEFSPNGTISILRHSNVFVDEETQLSDTYKRGGDGKWEHQQQWRWTRVPHE